LLKNSTTGASNLLSKPISETYEDLKKRVENIYATSNAALGPGMLSAIGLASLGTLGSQIIVCTDGVCNLVIGSIDTETLARSVNSLMTRASPATS
jgi:hypothetical protein